MKKLFAILLAAVMLCGVLALASCGDAPEETTPNATTPAETTPEATTPAETTPAETTPEATTPAETTTEPTVPVAQTTTLPVFARFDFGTDSKAQAEGLTSHDYLVSVLTYNAEAIEVSYTEDTVVIKALKAYTSGAKDTDFALCFEDLVTYDFDDELCIGWGGWAGAPWSQTGVGVEGRWQGRHQYIRIRMKNNTKNNMASFRWQIPGNPYALTMVCSNLYLQGGEPTSASDKKLTTTPSEDWFTVTYDYVWINGLASNKTRGAKNYFDYVKETEVAGSVNGNNMVWQTSASISSLRFYLLGAFSGYNKDVCDSRANIVAGATVEVDYILFGSSPESLDTYTSNIEDAAK